MSVSTMNPSTVRLERLLGERETVTKLHEDLVASVESREIGHREMNDTEREQAKGYRERSKALDEEIGNLHEALERELRSLESSKAVRQMMAGAVDGVEVNGDGQVAYRSFAQYAYDQILAFPKGSVCEQIAKRAGGPELIEAARERALRTPANTLSSNVAGLTPAQHIDQIFQVINTSRPLVATALRADLERGQLTYPQVDTKPVVAVQATQKTEAGNTGMAISMVTATASTYLGGGDLSWQAINWSTPNALDLWFRFAAADYALKTEQDAAQALQHSGFSNNIASTISGTPTFADFMTAIGAGYAEVFANSGRIANTVYMAPDRYGYLLGLTSAAFSQFTTVNGDNVGPLNVVISRGMDAGVIVVGDNQGLLVAETPGAPVELRVVEPAIGGVEVGIIGAFEAVVVDNGAFAMITTAS